MRILCVGLPHLKADSMSSKGILLRVMAGSVCFRLGFLFIELLSSI